MYIVYLQSVIPNLLDHSDTYFIFFTNATANTVCLIQTLLKQSTWNDNNINVFLIAVLLNRCLNLWKLNRTISVYFKTVYMKLERFKKMWHFGDAG